MRKGGEEIGYHGSCSGNEYPVRYYRILFLAFRTENGKAGEETGEERSCPGETGISHG